MVGFVVKPPVSVGRTATLSTHQVQDCIGVAWTGTSHRLITRSPMLTHGRLNVPMNNSSGVTHDNQDALKANG